MTEFNRENDGAQFKIPEGHIRLVTDYTGPVGQDRIDAIRASRLRQLSEAAREVAVQHNYSTDSTINIE